MLRETLEGQTLNGYKLEKLIGGGAMGAIFRASNPRFPIPLAVKVLSLYEDDEDSQAHRFQREARLLKALNHTNIVPIIDYGEANELRYFVMPLINGPTLEALMPRREFSPQAARLVLTPLTSALGYAHEKGIIHRDIKPGNIMLESREGGAPHVYLMDFGLGKRLLGDQSLQTESNITLGTPQYMAPEQVLGTKVDQRTDLYSLVVVLYQLLLGKLPFEHVNPQIIALRHVETPPPAPRTLNPKFPKGLQNVLLRALAKNPDERYQSAGDLNDAFTEALRGMSEAERKAIYRVEPKS
jgi:serine/threonine protein kinase